MRKFEKISFDQFKKDIEDNIDLYEKYKLPSRATKLSAGYDFYSLYDFTLKPNEIIKIPTGSSQGFKYNVRLCNQVGILDGDYYNNESNEGHIWIKIQNQGNKDYFVKSGEAICQGIFTKYLTVDNEEEIKNERKGGFGSTSEEK